jgi:hypothetical protein
MAHTGRAHLDQHLAGPRPDDLDIIANVELGVTNRMEYRSAHGAPPISGEFPVIRSKVEQVIVTLRKPHAAKSVQTHREGYMAGTDPQQNLLGKQLVQPRLVDAAHKLSFFHAVTDALGQRESRRDDVQQAQGEERVTHRESCR